MNLNTKVKLAIDAMMEGASRYAVYVTMNRQFADIRDGLLPVQRLTLWSLFGLTKLPKRDYVKCARVVGDTVGRYHPHSPDAAYDALCGMTKKHTAIAQLDGDGNFGGLLDKASAYRYTDCRLSDYGLSFVDKAYINEVPYVNNYDGKETVPVYLPALLPNVLLNGVFGIGYGYKADIPAFTAKSVAKLMAKAFAHDGQISERDCRMLLPNLVNNGVCSDLTQLHPFFASGEGRLRVEPKLRIDGKDVYIEGVYSLNLEKLAERFNMHPDVRCVTDASGKQSKSSICIIVQCSRNMATVAEELHKHLTDTVALRANLLINDIKPGYQHDNETLPSDLILYTMPQLVRTWVDYRVDLERRMLMRKVEGHGDSIYRIDALLKAAAHLKDFAGLLLEKVSREELVRKTSALLDCDEEQARIALATPFGRLAGLEIQQLEKERKQHIADTKALDHKIDHIFPATHAAVAETFTLLP